ncbi:energy transducer TonB [Chitinophaga rhizophila]|uniref:Energy transducer TonB n=1 Tax=Chitinophaga rhizophila TaxID=2866212 RepID=A0ABS7GE58_9BACT|nr:energy transducer TonB [Chitinophaga rhizophila]MBW8685943.1 energy transducer TonB [Chitinophaga rhizophila]
MMLLKRIFLLVTILFLANRCQAQLSLPLFDSRFNMLVYEHVDKMPLFPGGDMALAKFLSKIRYPKEQLDYHGKLHLSFIVDAEGNVLDKCIHNKKAADYTLLDKEGIMLLNRMPKWIPGQLNGKNVAVRVLIPMKICLQVD